MHLFPRRNDMHLLKRLAHLPEVTEAMRLDKTFAGQYELAVCTLFKDEAPYLHDWIAFHAAIGVEHFYLYDNDSTDDFATVLSPWLRRGLVTVTPFPDPAPGKQMSAFLDCTMRFRSLARWIAFIDVDEFLFAPNGRDLRDVLYNFRIFSAVFVPWRVFGSSGHEHRPTGHPGRAYTMRAPSHIDIEANGKSIANPRLIRRMAHPHFFNYWRGTTVFPNRRPIHGNLTGSLPADVLRLNHYWSRSMEELRRRASRPDINGVVPSLEQMLWRESRMNAERDAVIVPILDHFAL